MNAEWDAKMPMTSRLYRWCAPLIMLIMLVACACDGSSEIPLRVRDTEGATRQDVLVRAAAGGDSVMVARLLRLGIPPDSRDHDGHTALMEAARTGQVGMVWMLVQRGAAMEARNGEGSTPLLMAAGKSHVAVVRYLLEKGAQPCTRDHRGRTARWFAEAGGNEELLELVGTFEEATGGC